MIDTLGFVAAAALLIIVLVRAALFMGHLLFGFRDPDKE